MKNALIIVTLSALFSGCSTFSPAPGVQPAVQPTFASVAKPAVNLAAKPADEVQDVPVADVLASLDPPVNLPGVELTADLMAKLMASEVAAQRGKWKDAYGILLDAAKQTRDPRLARRAMEVARDADQGAPALVAIRLWRELDPKAEEANQLYLRFIVFGEDLDEVHKALKGVLSKAAPAERGYAILQIQQIMRFAKDKTAAFTVLESLLTPYKEWIEARLALSFSAWAKGDNVRALQEVRAARAINPASEEAMLTHALVLGDSKLANQELADFLAVYPNAKEVRLKLVRGLIEQRQYSQARREYEVLLKADPNNPALLYGLGVVAFFERDLATAQASFVGYLEGIKLYPQNDEREVSTVYSYLAQIAEERGDTAGALKWLTQMSTSDSREANQFGVQLRRASLIAKSGNLAQARALLKSLHAESTDKKVLLILTDAQILRNANQNKQAYAVLEAGLKRFPKNTDLLYDFALIAEKLDRWQIMERTLRLVIQLSPKEHQAYNALGYSFAERNIRLPEAQALIEKALQMAPDDPFILDSMGWVQFRMGKLSEAEALLRRSYGLRSDAEIAVHLGEVLWQKGQKAEAQKFWREAKSKDPKNDALKSTLARLNVSLP